VIEDRKSGSAGWAETHTGPRFSPQITTKPHFRRKVEEGQYETGIFLNPDKDLAYIPQSGRKEIKTL
jgi:hypothetical protein